MLAGTGDEAHWEPDGFEVMAVARRLVRRLRGQSTRIKRGSRILDRTSIIFSVCLQANSYRYSPLSFPR